MGLGPMRILDVGLFISVLGGGLSLASTLFPWYGVGGQGISLFEPATNSWFVPWLILIGGVLSILSRYGALVTSFGFWAYQSGPPLFMYFGLIPISVPEYSFGLGFWIAWIGILISLQGGSWNFAVAGLRLPNVMEWVFPGVGVLMAIIGIFAYDITRANGLSFLRAIPALAIAAMGMVMACSGLIRTGAWAKMYEPRSKNERR